MFKAKINGLTELRARINKVDKGLANMVDGHLTTGANNVALMARLRAPKGRRQILASSIRAETGNRFVKRVVVDAPFGPFVEFGTGVRVFQTPEFNFTPEMRAYAKEFYVNGLGVEPARPYLMPSFELEKLAILKRIKEDLFKN